MNIGGADASGNAVLWRVTAAGKIVGRTILKCPGSPSSTCGPAGFFIKGSRIATADALRLTVYLFDYPKGGDPIQTYVAPYVQPIGVAISS
jgi:hypothetical protein